MTNTSKRKIEVPFHPMTEELAKEWYSKNYLTTAGYLVAIKNIIRPPGVDLKINNVVAFCKEWGISKSAFYRAVETLKDEFEWEATHGIILRERSNTDEVITFAKRKTVPDVGQLSHERDTKSRKRDSQSHERDTKSRKRDSQSHKRDAKSSKPSQRKTSNAPQIYSDKSDIQTLSDMPQFEREDFEKFVREEHRKNKKEEIDSFTAFVGGDFFKEWYQKYQNRPELVQVAQSAKWENDERRDEWLHKIRTLGFMGFICEMGFKDLERQEFYQWADHSGIIWGFES